MKVLLFLCCALASGQTVTVQGCGITAVRAALIYVYQSAQTPGLINVSAGAFEAGQYRPTAQNVQLTGTCVATDVPDPTDPSDTSLVDFGQMVWLGAAGMPTPDVRLSGIFINFLPDWYRLGTAGLIAAGLNFSLTAPSGLTAAAQ